MPIDIRKLESPAVTELYLTACPSPGSADRQVHEVYADVAAVLRDTGALIIKERAFFTPGCAGAVAKARAESLGDLDDGVWPSLLHAAGNANGPVSGLQIHAVVGDVSVEAVEIDGERCGRIVRYPEGVFMTASGLTAPKGGTRVEQAQAMLVLAEKAVKMAGGDLFQVARTWMWLADLLEWYDDFNAVRNELFRQHGLLTDGGVHQLPASTGISVAPAGGQHCAMDMVASVGDGVMDRFLAGGDQDSAFNYGSAFSRAAKAKTPGGTAVYISGTAAIDADGNTEHLDDAPAQVADTIKHVRALLAQGDCTDDDVVQSMIYCKTPEVERAFRDAFSDLSWPQVIAVCDICRHDLLFEAEATACPGAKKV